MIIIYNFCIVDKYSFSSTNFFALNLLLLLSQLPKIIQEIFICKTFARIEKLLKYKKLVFLVVKNYTEI